MHMQPSFRIPWGIFCEMGAAFMENRIVVMGGRPLNGAVRIPAALLAKLGRAETNLPGGCNIGARPIDLHLAGLRQMGGGRVGGRPRPAGADGSVRPARGRDHPALPQRGGHGDARAGSGLRQRHHRAAGCGAGAGDCRPGRISEPLRRTHPGAGSSTLCIEGRRNLSGCVFSPLPDRIFASTLACAVAAAGGRAELSGCPASLYAPVLEILEQMGCRVEKGGDSVRLSRFGRLYGAGRVFTGVYPALATDAAPLLAAAMLCAEGESSIEDVIFERRFGCAAGFERLGAKVQVNGRTLCIRPGGTLRGTELAAPDLRGGAALVVAALAASGTSVIGHPEHIDRGYAAFTEILSSLGAQIRRHILHWNRKMVRQLYKCRFDIILCESILTVGIVTKPFPRLRGKRKMGLAEQGIANLLMHVDSLIVIPNERLKMISQEKITLMNAFQAADNVLRQGVESISALINVPAFINLDFADVRSIMKDAGYAHMGVGSAKGAGKAENAAKAAISSPLLETSIAGAHGVIINITSSPDIGLEELLAILNKRK